MKTYVSAKIHGIRVTDKSVRYHGSVSVCPELLELAGIESYEQVQVVNLSNGNRWITYAIPADPGQFTLNGGGARLGEVGDECVILTYQTSDRFVRAPVVFCKADNSVSDTMVYEHARS